METREKIYRKSKGFLEEAKEKYVKKSVQNKKYKN